MMILGGGIFDTMTQLVSRIPPTTCKHNRLRNNHFSLVR